MKIFIAGPRAITKLDDNIVLKLNNICNKNYDILIGDAKGIDTCVQQYLYSRLYQNVTVFATNGLARNNIRKLEYRKHYGKYQYKRI